MTNENKKTGKQSFAFELLSELKKEKEKLIIANIIQGIALFLAIIGLIVK